MHTILIPKALKRRGQERYGPCMRSFPARCPSRIDVCGQWRDGGGGARKGQASANVSRETSVRNYAGARVRLFIERHTQQTESSLRFFRHAPSTSAGISRKSKSPRICFHRCGGWVIRYRGSLCGALVLDDLRDGAHGAFLDAVAARNAGILVHNVSLAANNLEHFLRAGVDADATANALIGIDNRVRHVILLLVQKTREHTGNFPKNLLPARYHGSMQMQEKSAIFQGTVRILSWMLGALGQREDGAPARAQATTRGTRRMRDFRPEAAPACRGASAQEPSACVEYSPRDLGSASRL